MAALQVRAGETEIRGATVYSREEILHILRIRDSRASPRSDEELAALLEQRYRDDGYPAAHVEATRDGSGGLRLDVSEGHLGEIRIAELEGRALARALEILDLPIGSVLQESDVEDALERLETASSGAIRFGALYDTAGGGYSVDASPEGARLDLRPELPTLGVRPRIGVPGDAGRSNRVDGLNLSAGADVSFFDRASYRHPRLHVRAAWALGSEQLRVVAGALHRLTSRAPLIVGYTYSDVTDTEDSFRRTGLEEARGETYRTASVADYFRRTGHEAYAWFSPAERLSLRVAWRGERYESLPTTTRWTLFDEEPPLPNAPVDELTIGAVVANVSFDSGSVRGADAEDLLSSVQRRPDPFAGDPISPGATRVDLEVEIASPDLGGDADFRRAVLRARSRHELVRGLRLDTRAMGGWSGGDPPLQKLFSIGGPGTIRGFDLKAFSGTRFALLTAELSWALGRAVPRLIAFYDGGAIAGRSGSDGWRSGAGLGARWPPSGTSFLRVDVARPLDGDEDGYRGILRIQLPL